MNYSDVQICNLALSLMGSTAMANADMLDQLNGNASDVSSEPAMAKLQLLYPLARDYAQTKLAPAECIRYIAPTAATTGVANPGWTYTFNKPTGCLQFLNVVSLSFHDEQTGDDLVYPHTEIANQIATDQASDGILFKYVVSVEDTTKFSYGLIMVIAHRLAYIAARPVGGLGQEARAELLMEYMEALVDARGMDGRSHYHRPTKLTINNAHYRKASNMRVVEDANGNLMAIG